MSGRPDPKLIKLLVRAHRLKEKLRGSPGARIADLAMREKLSPSYVALLLRLTFLAPDRDNGLASRTQPSESDLSRRRFGCASPQSAANGRGFRIPGV